MQIWSASADRRLEIKMLSLTIGLCTKHAAKVKEQIIVEITVSTFYATPCSNSPHTMDSSLLVRN